MYDEIVKRLREVADEVDNDYDVDPYNAEQRCLAILQAADAIEDAIEDLEFACNRYEKDYKALCEYLPKWISVEERLPKEKTNVLILADTIAGKMAKVSLLYKNDEGKNCWTGLDVYGLNPCDWQPTHWMPLPEPPKEET